MASQQESETAQHFIYITQVYFCSMCKSRASRFLVNDLTVHRATDAVVLWDWAISLPREWRFVWRTHWTPVKVAYLFCRYWVIAVVPYLLYCFVMDHPKETCERIFRIPVGLAMWNQVGSESVLLIRTYAFFNRNIFVLWFLICSMAGVVAYQLYVDSTQMLLLPFVKPSYNYGPCLPMSKPHSAHLLGFFIAPLLFDTLVTFMTIWKAIYIRRRNGGPNSRLIQTFLREGVFYYLLISIANLINGVFYLQPRQVISAINIPLSVMLAPVLACRLILDLRERGSETVTHSEGTGMAAFTTKSVAQQGSPFTPPHHRQKSAMGTFSRNTRLTNTLGSGVMLSTIGSLAPDLEEMDMEQDLVEMENIRIGLGMGIGRLSTCGDSEDLEKSGSSSSPAPAYHALEMGFRAARRPSSDEICGIKVEVEKTTTTM
ncbi:hypothetical protein EYR40_003692 [Pleurotus pulmonarius]|nr:hypothetical protein EYR40_003692 [Pleurotus pulmonarius]KAF4606405.1 hypothetical protein EYR38_000459 [Pleurotus pulmonarius]